MPDVRSYLTRNALHWASVARCALRDQRRPQRAFRAASVLAAASICIAAPSVASTVDRVLVLRFLDPTVNRTGPAQALLFSADGKVLAAINGDRVVTWDVMAGTELHAASVERPHQLCRMETDVAIVERVAIEKRKFGGCKVTRASTGTAVSSVVFSEFDIPHSADWEWVSFAPSANVAACIVDGFEASPAGPVVVEEGVARRRPAFPGRVVVFALTTGKVLRKIPAPDETRPVPVEDLRLDVREAQARALVLSPNGKALAAVSRIGTITVWNSLDGSVTASLAGDRLDPYQTEFRLVPGGETTFWRRTLIWSADSSALLTISSGAEDSGFRRLVRWDLASGNSRTIEWLGARIGRTVAEQVAAGDALREHARHNGVAKAIFVACSPDASRAYVAQERSGGSKSTALEIVDLLQGVAIGLLRIPETQSIQAVAFSPDGTRVALATGSGSVIVAPTSLVELFAREQRSLVDFKPAATARAHTDK